MEAGQIGNIRSVDIENQMRDAYLDYAMSVIVARALPDARDGLKPVHRRILYAMYDMGIRANTSYKKCARIVGEVLGKYHPHGDAAVYDAMARMAQDFSLRYMLVDGQGNFGSVDGDAPAAMRYTEARLARIAEEHAGRHRQGHGRLGATTLTARSKSPTVLPAMLPNLLLNGTSGIAVGMATNIPPHNLNEMADAIAYLIDNYDTVDDVTVEELMQFVQGPRLPDRRHHRRAPKASSRRYATGRGRIVMRGAAHIEEMAGNGRIRIVVTEIPYQVNKSSLIERIADLVREGRLDTISDLRDEIRPATACASSSSSSAARSRARCSTSCSNTPRCRAPLACSCWRWWWTRPPQRAAPAVAQARAANLYRAPPRGHHAPHRVRPGQGPRPRAHPGRAADRPGQPGRGHPHHPRIRRRRQRPRQPDVALQAHRGAGPGHPRYAAAPAGRPGTPEDPGRARGDDEDASPTSKTCSLIPTKSWV